MRWYRVCCHIYNALEEEAVGGRGPGRESVERASDRLDIHFQTTFVAGRPLSRPLSHVPHTDVPGEVQRSTRPFQEAA